MSTAIILVGRPGSGKGTLAKSVEEFLHVSSSEILQRYGSKEVKDLIHEGKMVSEHLAIPILMKGIEVLDRHQSVILDGMPRTTAQYHALIPTLRGKFGSLLVVHVNVSESVAIRRALTRLDNRKDDTPDKMRGRMREYRELTLPTLNLYQHEGIPTYLVNNQDGESEKAKGNFRTILNESRNLGVLQIA